MSATVPEIRIDLCDYKAEKQRLVAIKTSLSARLAEINAACKVRLPTKEYQRLQSERGQLASQVSKVEGELSEVNQRITEANTVLSSKTAWNVSVPFIRELVALRDEYHEISMDPKQSAAGRRIAFTVSQKLRAILKPYFDNRPEGEQS